MAYNTHGQMMASMCISLGDFDNDGWLDLYISDFQKNSDHVWRNSGKGYFDEVSDEAGITLATKDVLSFGGGFFDYDNDGWLDIFIGNGHVYPEDRASLRRHALQAAQFPLPQRNKRQIHRGHPRKAASTHSLLAQPAASPSPISITMATSTCSSPTTAIRRHSSTTTRLHKNHFVNFKLVGTKSNRDALGARIKITADDINQIREIAGGGSYLSQSDLRANFGLGDATTISTVEITWPSGAHQTFQNVPADHFYQITEGRPQLSPSRTHQSSSDSRISAPPLAHSAPLTLIFSSPSPFTRTFIKSTWNSLSSGPRVSSIIHSTQLDYRETY